MHAPRPSGTNVVLKVSLVAVAAAVSVTVAVGVLSHQQSAQAQDASVIPSYTVTHLGTLGSVSLARGINDAGQVVGFARLDDYNPAVEHPFLYDASATPKMTDLGTLGGSYAGANDINDSGLIVGTSMTSMGERAFLYDESTSPKMMDLGTLGGPNSAAFGINEAGQVVGHADTIGEEIRAFLYDASATPRMTDLGTLGGRLSVAYGINEAGQVVGYADTSGGPSHAFLYDANATPKMTDLGTLGGTYSEANGINEAGQVVGYANTSSEERHAFLYDASATPKMTDLGTLGGRESFAYDINEAGQVVGHANTIGAFLYSGGRMVDLHSLIPPDSGWVLSAATAINNTGQIVGYGSYNGDLRAFLLTPKRYAFGGFFGPVDNPPTLNVLKAGAAVPVKFSLGGDEGLDVFAEGYPKSHQVECSSSSPLDAIEQTVRARASNLSYDANTGHYTYAWTTQKAWRGTCRQLVLQFDDGSVHRADFKFIR